MKQGRCSIKLISGIISLFLIFCPSFANAQKIFKNLLTKPSVVKPITKWNNIHLSVFDIIHHPSLPINSGIFLGIHARHDKLFEPQPYMSKIGYKLECIPNSLKPIPSEPTFAPQEEKSDWFDQMIKDIDLKEIFKDFNFDIDWDNECDELYYVLIKIYGRAITDAA
jgi:hypothetical protein